LKPAGQPFQALSLPEGLKSICDRIMNQCKNALTQG